MDSGECCLVLVILLNGGDGGGVRVSGTVLPDSGLGGGLGVLGVVGSHGVGKQIRVLFLTADMIV